MAIETLPVVEVAPGLLTVGTLHRQHCSKCAARAGCGHQLLHNLHRQRSNTLSLHHNPEFSVQHHAGEAVAVSIEEGLLISRSLLLYLFPVLGLLVATTLAEWAASRNGGSELWVILAASVALGGCLALVRRLAGSLGDTADSMVRLTSTSKNRPIL